MALSELVLRLRSYDAEAPWAMLELALAQGDGACPRYEDFNGQALWTGDCQTGAGVDFDGWALAFRGQDQLQPDGRVASDFLALTSTLEARWPDGSRVHLGGDASAIELPGVDGSAREVSLTVQGAFRTDRPELLDRWVSSAQMVVLNQEGQVADGRTTLSTEARLSWTEPEAGAAEVRGLVVTELEGGCSLALEALYLWWPAHGQVELAFEPAELLPGCVACGDALWQDLELGQVCVELSSLVDWSSTPW